MTFFEHKDNVVFDLDGTLANADQRLHHICGADGRKLPKPNWEWFFQDCIYDSPIQSVCAIFDNYVRKNYQQQTDNLMIWTGRSSQVFSETIDWLQTYLCMEWTGEKNELTDLDCVQAFFNAYPRRMMRGSSSAKVELKMRQHGIKEQDHYLKQKWFCAASPSHQPTVAFEDRSRVVQMWRDLGVICFQVADGDF